MSTIKKINQAFAVAAVMVCIFVMIGSPHSRASWVFDPAFPTNEWGAVTNDCQLGLRVPKFQYEAGEKILVMPILRNVGDKHFMYAVIGEYAEYDVVVKKADGQTAPFTDWWAKFIPGGNYYRTFDAPLEPHQECGAPWIDVT